MTEKFERLKVSTLFFSRFAAIGHNAFMRYDSLMYVCQYIERKQHFNFKNNGPDRNMPDYTVYANTTTTTTVDRVVCHVLAEIKIKTFFTIEV